MKIAALTQEDSGNYWCTLETDNSITCLQDVHLHVLSEYSSEFSVITIIMSQVKMYILWIMIDCISTAHSHLTVPTFALMFSKV